MKSHWHLVRACLGMGLLPVLTACPLDPSPTEIFKLNKDPRILSGNWRGALVEVTTRRLLAVSPDGNLLVTHEDKSSNTIVLRNVTTGSVIKTLIFPAEQAVFQNNETLVGLLNLSGILSIGFINVQTGQFESISLPPRAIGQAFFSQDGKKLLWLEPNKVAGLDLETRLTLPAITVSPGQNLYNPVISPSGNLIAFLGYNPGRVEIWSAAGNLRQFTSPAYSNLQVSFSTNEQRLVITNIDTNNCIVDVWDISSGNQVSSLTLPACGSSLNSPFGFTALVVNTDASQLRVLTHEKEANSATPARYRLSWAKGNQIEESLELPIPNLGILRQSMYIAQPTMTALGTDTLVLYEGGFGRVSAGAFAWKLQPRTLSLTLNLQTKYLDEKKYSISGTAQLDNQTFTVQGVGYARNNSKIVAQFAPIPPPFLQFQVKLSSEGEVKWSLAGEIPSSYSLTQYVVGAIQGDGPIGLNDYGGTSLLLEQPFVTSLQRQP